MNKKKLEAAYTLNIQRTQQLSQSWAQSGESSLPP